MLFCTAQFTCDNKAFSAFLTICAVACTSLPRSNNKVNDREQNIQDLHEQCSMTYKNQRRLIDCRKSKQKNLMFQAETLCPRNGEEPLLEPLEFSAFSGSSRPNFLFVTAVFSQRYCYTRGVYVHVYADFTIPPKKINLVPTPVSGDLIAFNVF